MASLKADKPVGIQSSGQAKQEANAKATDAGSSKAPSSKKAPKRAASEPKKKGKGGKAVGKD